MIEIARAFTESDAPAKIVILDEPTSSLDSTAADQLLSHLRRAASQGRACILITHKLNEVLNHTQRIVVMKDAQVVADVAAAGLSRDHLFELMGAVAREETAPAGAPFRGQRRIELVGPSDTQILHVEAGEVVGLAGLAGHGQKEILRRIYRASRTHKDKTCRVNGAAAYASGDRQREGIFPLWSMRPTSLSRVYASSHIPVSSAPLRKRALPKPGARRSASAARLPQNPSSLSAAVTARRRWSRVPLNQLQNHPVRRSDARGRYRHQARAL